MSTFSELIQKQIDGSYFKKERTPDTHTIGDLIGAVMAIDNEDTARKFYEDYLAWLADKPYVHDLPVTIARSNIGWCFGEGMAPERIAMWSKVCGASHPIFGTSTPTPEEAFAAGFKAMCDE